MSVPWVTQRSRVSKAGVPWANCLEPCSKHKHSYTRKCLLGDTALPTEGAHVAKRESSLSTELHFSARRTQCRHFKKNQNTTQTFTKLWQVCVPLLYITKLFLKSFWIRKKQWPMWLKETYSGKLLQETLGNQTRRNSIASGETEGNKFCLTATVRGWKSLLKGNKEKEEKKKQPLQALHGSILHLLLWILS